jgi:putative NIF3 family GTP cyclohydrolase 1 type 2
LIDEISRIFDNLFEIETVEKDLPFGIVLPQLYQLSGINIVDFFCPSFLRNYLGLMIKNSEKINKVIGTVFLNNTMIEDLISNQITDVLIFTHHPMEDQTSGQGFTPLRKELLLKMKENRISVYSLHSPLDYNDKMSTALSFGKAIGLRNLKRFSKYLTGYIGVYGDLTEEVSFDQFTSIVKVAVGVPEIHFIKKSQNVRRVGLIPGGGTGLSFFREVISLNCDTYLTGEYYSRLTIPFGDEERRKFDEVKNELPINMIEASHYATEKLVMVNEIAELFRQNNIPYQFIEQDNPWY